MASPILELQGLMIAAIKAALSDMVGGRVYDAVPAGASFPYVSLGAVTELQDDADCIDGAEITVQWDVWSRGNGSPEALRIADALKRALHRVEASLTDNALVFVEHVRTTRLRDPDGITYHCAVEFRAIVETP